MAPAWLYQSPEKASSPKTNETIRSEARGSSLHIMFVDFDARLPHPATMGL
jgi:hypothetical protein